MTPGAGYREMDESKYLQFQVRLLKHKGGQLQLDFLESVRDNVSFLSLLTEEAAYGEGNILPTFDGPLTESSFKEPTADQEKQMYTLWHEVSPSTACRVSFWAGVTLEHIRSEKIAEANWLAANGGINETGEERIEWALSRKANDRAKAVDQCVRTVLRRMSGLPAARGNRSVFVNPSFGRGWWRERIVNRISERGNAVQSRAELLEVVRQNQQYWENLVTMIVSRGSVFGSVDVQDALINSLAKHFSEYDKTPLRNAATLNTVLRRFSNLAASRELGTLEFSEIGKIADGLLVRVQQTVN